MTRISAGGKITVEAVRTTAAKPRQLRQDPVRLAAQAREISPGTAGEKGMVMRNLMTCSLVSLSVAACCASAPPDPVATITQGVYGQVTTYSDMGSCRTPTAVDGDHLELRTTTGTPVSTAETDTDGVFQIAAAAGDYELCMLSNSTCLLLTVPAQGVVRRDYTYGEFNIDWH
jgi:hypothetical protein